MPWGGWQRGGGCIRDVKDVGSNSLRGRWGGPRGNAWWVLFPVCVLLSKGFAFLSGEGGGFIALLNKVSWMRATRGAFYIPQLEVTY